MLNNHSLGTLNPQGSVKTFLTSPAGADKQTNEMEEEVKTIINGYFSGKKSEGFHSGFGQESASDN